MKVKSLITYDFICIKLISRKGNRKCRWGESPHASYPWWSVKVLFHCLPSVRVYSFLLRLGKGYTPVSSICFGDQSEGHSLAKQSCACTSWMVLHMHRGAVVSLCPCVRTLLLVTGEQRRKGLSRSGKEWARFTWRRRMNPFQKQN